jgi:nucleoside triphosphate diphosphatase
MDIPPSPLRGDIGPLLDIMERLRDPEAGCPWDVEQDFATIAPFTIEEAYEVADAIERADMDGLRDELGDLLFQAVFHARIAEEADHFDFSDVIESICTKMIRRHPHVFGDDKVRPDWEALKAAERKSSPDTSALAGVAVSLPALLRAEKIQKRAARTGFDWPDPSGALGKIFEEIEEVTHATSDEHRAEEVGDLLFAVVNWARHLGVDPEAALRSATSKFERRFRTMETVAGDDFQTLNLEEKEALWAQAKLRD